MSIIRLLSQRSVKSERPAPPPWTATTPVSESVTEEGSVTAASSSSYTSVSSVSTVDAWEHSFWEAQLGTQPGASRS